MAGQGAVHKMRSAVVAECFVLGGVPVVCLTDAVVIDDEYPRMRDLMMGGNDGSE